MRKAYQIAAVFIGSLISGQAIATENLLSVVTKPHFVKNEMFGRVLVGKNGAALYTFKKDHKLGGYPAKCTTKKDDKPLGSCLKRWPAASISYKDLSKLLQNNPKLPYGAIYNREVKSLQITYQDLPLYYWFGDKVKSKTNFTGLGVLKAWDLKSLDKNIGYDGAITNK